MHKLRMGLKLWSSNVDLIPGAQKLIEEGVFDYVELTPVPDTDVGSFVDSALDFVVHVTHERFGFNIADSSKKEVNEKIVEECIRWADLLSAKYLVLHPGFGEIKDSLDFLSTVDDERILIENMPYIGVNGEKMVGCLPEQVEELMGERFGFCLDFGHAIKAAHSIGVGYKKMLADLMKLGPSLFHLHGGNSAKEEDEHLPLSDGDFDMAYIVECLLPKKGSRVTLETPRRRSLVEDVQNLDYLKGLIGDDAL